jgi:hypothetical protein
MAAQQKKVGNPILQEKIMSDADIDRTATLPLFPLVVFWRLFLFTVSRFLAAFRFGGRRHGSLSYGRGSLGLNLGQNVRDCLRRQRGWRGSGYRQWRDLYHDLTLGVNRNTIFTILLQGRNEETVKHFVFKCILDKSEVMGLLVRPVTIGSI